MTLRSPLNKTDRESPTSSTKLEKLEAQIMRFLFDETHVGVRDPLSDVPAVAAVILIMFFLAVFIMVFMPQ